jgi:hypothetical protein
MKIHTITQESRLPKMAKVPIDVTQYFHCYR